MNSEKKETIMPIRGKVARILNSREVAINVGNKDGVQPGMYFDILHDVCHDIRDPDTGDILGSVDLAKVRVKVIHVQEKLSLVSTYKKKRVNLGGNMTHLDVSTGFAQTLLPPRWVTRYETLKTEENIRKDWEDLDEKDSYVKTGDPVVQVLLGFEEEQTQDGEPVTRLAETA